MKKLLISMLVLAIASVANAQIEPQLSIYVNGADPGAEYTMLSGSVISLGIYSDGVGGVNGKYSGALVLNIDATDTGTGILQGTPIIYNGSGEPLEFLGGADAFVAEPAVGIFIATNPVLADKALAGVGFDFEFLCTSLDGDVTVTIVDDVFGPVDTLTIHQIPEPITFALLGLGGLFLRRRK